MFAGTHVRLVPSGAIWWLSLEHPGEEAVASLRISAWQLVKPTAQRRGFFLGEH